MVKSAALLVTICMVLAAAVGAVMQESVQKQQDVKPRIGPHYHNLVLTGRPKPHAEQLKKSPSADIHSTFENGEEERMLDPSELSAATMRMNLTMDERLNDYKNAWLGAFPTLFDLYDYSGKTTVPLNYVEAEWTNLAEPCKKPP